MTDTLRVNESLGVGENLSSQNGLHQLHMQADGNLVLYSGGSAVWDSRTWGTPWWIKPVRAELREDGNLVLVSNFGFPAWQTGSGGQGAARLVLQNDRNLVLYRADNTPVWSTGTWIPVPAAPSAAPVLANRRQEVGWGKFMETSATLYRDGTLACDIKTENNNWSGGLRGRLLVLGVGSDGRAVWVSQVIEATTRCSVPDFSCASFGRDSVLENWPEEAAGLVARLDIYQADAAAFSDLRQSFVDAIKTAADIANKLGPLLKLL